MVKNTTPTQDGFSYEKSESAQLAKFRLWTKILAITSGILLAACTFLLAGAILLVGNEDRLAHENDKLKTQIAARNSEDNSANSNENSGNNSAENQVNSENAGENLIKNLDTTKLLTKNDVGENQIPDHFQGETDAKLVVIEYEDFACSHCQALHAPAQKIHAEYGDRVLFIHRAFNLSFPNSEITLAAAEAAYLVGGESSYWQMLNLLYSDTIWLGNAVENPEEKLQDYATEIGLDAAKFDKILKNRAENGIDTKIARDKAAGIRAGVKGTPTWFVGGAETAGTDSKIRAALEEAL